MFFCFCCFVLIKNDDLEVKIWPSVSSGSAEQKNLLLSPAFVLINSGKVSGVADISNISCIHNFWPCRMLPRYYPALRTLEQLEESCLPQAGSYRFCTIMAENIPRLRTQIRDVSMSDLKDFLESIRKHSDKIGETAMKQVCVLVFERGRTSAHVWIMPGGVSELVWQLLHVLTSDLMVTAGFQHEVSEGRTMALFFGSLMCLFPIFPFILSLII